MADTDTASANKAYFNKLAAEYDARYEKTMLQLEREIRKRKDFIGADWVVDEDDGGEGGSEDEAAQLPASDGKRVRLLDYACGTGLISRALSQFTTHCVGIDISENMVAVYNARAENQGLRTDEMHAYQGDLTDPSDPDPAAFSASFDPNGRFRDFDVAGVGLGFHHFSDPELSARRIVERLRHGGVFFILDFLPHWAVDAALPAASTVMHHGFSEERMRAVFEQAGAGKDFALEELGSGIVLGGHRHSEGDGHGHGHTRDDGHGHGHGHGRGEREMGRKRRVFLARGTKV
ncbi:methyltransferase domain-containing protein [Colletotrichum graminicola]|uniref:Methyltransferase domain-containing protein n=1 Tax=Colletotrichum graminicola (strain M1.001 / M2 / FGSC 10212) TaxID=645133 RepID=E3QF38_COLGM|nr:methyltransferase domain-containing protein [Colletotrichum graminicola M1.001]EFQ29476.1 methyltransferase domain-containing protein [Colletotrichum graminicola M1.001]WDK23427.1 methyltransferase domain-containing protein [Colletotrichum graminicola]